MQHEELEDGYRQPHLQEDECQWAPQSEGDDNFKVPMRADICKSQSATVSNTISNACPQSPPDLAVWCTTELISRTAAAWLRCNGHLPVTRRQAPAGQHRSPLPDHKSCTSSQLTKTCANDSIGAVMCSRGPYNSSPHSSVPSSARAPACCMSPVCLSRGGLCIVPMLTL